METLRNNVLLLLKNLLYINFRMYCALYFYQY